MLFESRQISVQIEKPLEEVYQFLSKPLNFTKWASGLAKGLTKSGDEWIAETPEGPMRVKFSPKNSFGILDHSVFPRPDFEVHIPMRAIANGSGTEVIFTLFRLPEMSDEKFLADVE
jgi:carbon monoxide dehydrogenase subunit G